MFCFTPPYSYDSKDTSDAPVVPAAGGNAPRLMKGTVGPASPTQGQQGSAGQLSRGGSVQHVHEFSDNSDEDEEELTAEQQLRRRLGQLGN